MMLKIISLLLANTLITLSLVKSAFSLNSILLRNELRQRSSQQEIYYNSKKLMAKIYDDQESKNLSESNYYYLEQYWIYLTAFAILGILLISFSITLDHSGNR